MIAFVTKRRYILVGLFGSLLFIPISSKLSNMADPKYRIVISHETYNQLVAYKSKLTNGATPGKYLHYIISELNTTQLTNLTNEQFLQKLLLTKKPIIFAESSIRGDGSDWNEDELRLLGDVNVAMPVEIYDNGVWSTRDAGFKSHKTPFNGELLFTPGPLLHKAVPGLTPDLKEISETGKIIQNKYNLLIERRLHPLFVYANDVCKKEGVKAVITIPGIGCGAFAGKYRGTMGERLDEALQHILKNRSEHYPEIKCIIFSPFGECKSLEKEFKNVKYKVMPGVPLLSDPREYLGNADDTTRLKLFKVVAWDHVSYPGNDFFAMSRVTDDGVSAAATNSMSVLLDIEGRYRYGNFTPTDYDSWKEAALMENKIIIANDNVDVITGGDIYRLLGSELINKSENVEKSMDGSEGNTSSEKPACEESVIAKEKDTIEKKDLAPKVSGESLGETKVESSKVNNGKGSKERTEEEELQENTESSKL